jgi:DNA polymerase-3 subunit epsilon/ATP-dependent DNA helicase DinG
MRSELVAIDLETTGLNTETDSIIEIGAVRLRNGNIVEEYGTLVNPGFTIPSEVTYITGIRQEDLRGKPSIADLIAPLAAFVGDAPVVAHNVGFDIAVLRRFNILKTNLTLDTLELASVLLPAMPRYGLGGLTTFLGIVQENQHRALDDARATALLYWRLYQEALQLPAEVLEELVVSGAALQWELATVFRSALNDPERSSQPVKRWLPYVAQAAPLAPGRDEPQPVDVTEVVQVLSPEGTLPQHIAHYEYRHEQIAMTEAVTEALNTPHHLLVEAGTGTGKSLAYLVPAAAWAAANQERVVVATNTINLQEQLLSKDIPLVHRLLKDDFVASVMKGRANYLCPRRLEAVRRRRPTNRDELRLMAKILVWMQRSGTGDRAEITLLGSENAVWARLSAEDEGCTTHQCETLMRGVCPFYKARKKAETSQILIVNHALLISDATSENSVLPDYRCAIIDEAHQLEEAITSGLSVRQDRATLLRRIGDLGGVNNGLLGDLLNAARGHVSEKQMMRFEAFAQVIGDAVAEIRGVIIAFFQHINDWVADTRREGAGTTRITRTERAHSAFVRLQGSSAQLDEYLGVISDAMNQLVAYLNRLADLNLPNFDDHINSASAAARYLDTARASLNEFIHNPDPNHVYWIETYSNPDFTALQIAPLHIGEMMRDLLWDKKRSVVLTSATLDANDDFAYIRSRLSADDVKSLKIGSPFDYRQSTLLYLPTDIPDPNRPGYQQSIERGIIELATALEGRLLVLFTSYTHLRETVTTVGPRLALGNITVYDQAIGGSRETLLEGFRTTRRAVLMGTRSFWQGIDLPGDELLGLIIVKLPFAVPTDPVFAARSETYRDSFDNYAVPDAILRFRQGFGRLIRTQQDRGIVSIFDARVTSKGYGRHFLESLPDCTTHTGPLSSIGEHAKAWLRPHLERSE